MLSKEQEETETLIESALDRISIAEDVDDQVDREIRRYWNDQVQHSENKGLMRRLRLAIVKLSDKGWQ